MRNYWILTRLMLRNMLSSMNPLKQTDLSKLSGWPKIRAMLRPVFLVLVMLMAPAFVIFVEFEMYKGITGLAQTMRLPGQELMLPGLAIFASMTLTLVIGLFQGLSELFQGKDAPFLAVLPLTSTQVFSARMTMLYLSELALDALFTLPAFVLYAVGTGKWMPTAVTALPVLLLLPVLPLAIVALVSSLLMRIGVFARHRESVVMILSVVLALGYSIGVTMLNASAPGDGSYVTYLVDMMTKDNAAVNLLLNRLPPARWALDAFTGDWLKMLLFAGVSLGAAALLVILVGPAYLEQALASTERTVMKKTKGQRGSWRTSRRFAALHALEWKEILRTPAWAYNSLMGVVMFPVMIAIGFFAGFSRAAESGGLESMRQLFSSVDPGYVALVAAGVLAFSSMVNPAVATAISREGGRWPFALTLPVRQRTRFAAKLMVGVEINLLCGVMLAGVAWYMTRMSLLWLLAAFALSQVIGVAAAAAALWVDATRPQLKWNSEMEAIKKNFNQVFGMLIWMVFMGLCVIPAIFLWERGGGIAMLGSAGVALLELAVSLLLLNKVTEKHLVLQE